MYKGIFKGESKANVIGNFLCFSGGIEQPMNSTRVEGSQMSIPPSIEFSQILAVNSSSSRVTTEDRGIEANTERHNTVEENAEKALVKAEQT